MIYTFSCGFWRNGYEAYALFRKALEMSQLPSEGLEEFDRMADEFFVMRSEKRSDAVTKRLVGSTADQVQTLP